MSAFMSGMISGFMDTFGAGGGFGAAGAGAGAAGGVAGSAGADTGAASIAADSSTAGSDMAAQGATQAPAKSGGGGPLGGMMGGGGMGIPGMGGGGSSAPSTPAPQGGGAAGAVSTNTNVAGTNAANMSSPGMQPDSSGIIRQNPYGEAPKQGPTTSDYMKAALKGAQQGSQLGQGNQVRDQMNVNMGNSYSALFGSATQVGNYGGGQVGVQSPQIAATPAPPVNLAPPQMAAMQAPPMAMQMPPPPQPQQPPPMAVSDQLAKKNIRVANRDMDLFLQRVYENVTSKGKR